MNRTTRVCLFVATFVALLIMASASLAFTPSGLLEIHHINVQQGDCTLIIGADGTTFLIDAGSPGKGNNEAVPYLENEVGQFSSRSLACRRAVQGRVDQVGPAPRRYSAGPLARIHTTRRLARRRSGLRLPARATCQSRFTTPWASSYARLRTDVLSPAGTRLLGMP